MDLTQYIEEHNFRFDEVYDEEALNQDVSQVITLRCTMIRYSHLWQQLSKELEPLCLRTVRREAARPTQ